MIRAAERLMFAMAILMLTAGSAAAGWESGTKFGFDSNVDR